MMHFEDVEKYLIEIATDYLKSQGFTHLAEDPAYVFTKFFPFGFDQLSFDIFDRGGNGGIKYILSRRYNAIEEHWNKYYEMANGYPLIAEISTIATNAIFIDKKYEKYPDDAMMYSGADLIRDNHEQEDLQLYFEEFKWQYENLLTPVLEKSRDVRWLDQKINSEPFRFKDFGEIIPTAYSIEFHKLIIARLAGNSNYEQIYQLVRGTLVEWAEEEEQGKNMLSAFDKVYEDLKDVKPLENPILE
jgi:hypothetical protein